MSARSEPVYKALSSLGRRYQRFDLAALTNEIAYPILNAPAVRTLAGPSATSDQRARAAYGLIDETIHRFEPRYQLLAPAILGMQQYGGLAPSQRQEVLQDEGHHVTESEWERARPEILESLSTALRAEPGESVPKFLWPELVTMSEACHVLLSVLMVPVCMSRPPGHAHWTNLHESLQEKVLADERFATTWREAYLWLIAVGDCLFATDVTSAASHKLARACQELAFYERARETFESITRLSPFSPTARRAIHAIFFSGGLTPHTRRRHIRELEDIWNIYVSVGQRAYLHRATLSDVGKLRFHIDPAVDLILRPTGQLTPLAQQLILLTANEPLTSESLREVEHRIIRAIRVYERYPERAVDFGISEEYV